MAVALLAVVQQQLSARFHGDGNPEADAADSHYYGLVGLSLTYALPIVGENYVLLAVFCGRVAPFLVWFSLFFFCRGRNASIFLGAAGNYYHGTRRRELKLRAANRS